jgi:hypothetical protein
MTPKKYIIGGVLLLMVSPFAAGVLAYLAGWGWGLPLAPAVAGVICLLAGFGMMGKNSAEATPEPKPRGASDLERNLNLIAQSKHMNQTGRNNLAAAMKLAAERAKNKGK